MSDARRDEVQAWLRKAAREYRAARVDLDAEPPLLENVMFHCQQAAEKLFKAFLTAHGRTFRKMYDLDVLGQKCTELDPSLEPGVDSVTDLGVLAWQLRCPADADPPAHADAEDALRNINALSTSVRERLDQYIT